MESSGKSIYKKMQEVSVKVKNIEKKIMVGTGSNAYKAVGDADVVREINKAEKEVGLVSFVKESKVFHQEIIKAQNDKGYTTLKYSFVVLLTLAIVDIESGEIVEVESVGHGLDSADKAPGKAMTYARKYALLNAYKIPTGEDPDAEKSVEHKAVITPSVKRIAVSNYLMTDAIYRETVLPWANVERIEDIPEDKIVNLYDSLKQRGLL